LGAIGFIVFSRLRGLSNHAAAASIAEVIAAVVSCSKIMDELQKFIGRRSNKSTKS
jgi:hypothetical protein